MTSINDITRVALATVRHAQTQDAHAVAHLYETSFPEHIMVHRGLLNNPEYLRGRFAAEDERWVVAERDSAIVGVAALAIIPPVGLAEIERVCVQRTLRGSGVAYRLCEALVEEARARDIGFVEAFARGDQPGMQRAAEKAGFRVYGISPRFEVIHDGVPVREQFVHMGLELKPETIDERTMKLIPAAQRLYDAIHHVD
jgi:N-acetylglutamate synthase-like GNAT family acetyltransferase